MKEKILKAFFRILRKCLSSEFNYRMFCGYCGWDRANPVIDKNGNFSCNEKCWKYFHKKIEKEPDYSCEI